MSNFNDLLDRTVRPFLGGLHAGRPMTSDNLTIVPMFGPRTGPEVILLSEALQRGTAEVTEVRERAQVDRVTVVNRSPVPILVLDGEEIVGARQNRVVSSTILVPGANTLDLPVSCVERGRWRTVSATFRSEGRRLKPDMRASNAGHVTTNLSSTGRIAGDQRTVWREVAAYSETRSLRSETNAMSDIMRHDAPAIQAMIRNLPAAAGQTGVVVYINRSFVSLEMVGRHDVYLGLHPQVLQSSAAQAIEYRNRKRETPHRAHRMREQLSFGPWKAFVPPGVGLDLRVEIPGFRASALLTQSGIAHLACYPSDGVRMG